MKSYFKLLLFIFTAFLLLLSCEKEEHRHQHTEQSVIARNEKITNYPKLKSFLQNNNNLFGRNSTDYLELINNENISIITHDNGNKTYTFSLNIVETDKLTNLVVLESDEEYKLTLVEYSSSDIERWKEDLQNNQISDVEINVTATSLNTTESICIVDGYTCPSGLHSSGQEQHCEFQFSTWSYFMYQVPCPDNGGTVGGGGGNPGNPNPTPEIPVHEPPFTEPNWPTLSPAITSFIMGLSPSQSVWWNSANPTIKSQIINYLMLNIRNEVVNPQALAFALEIINSGLQGTLISVKPFFKYPPNSNYATLYPNFTSLVKDYMEYLRNDNNLINTISDLTGQSNSTIIEHLTWGRGAEINVVQLGNAPDGTQYKGMFNPLYPDKIFIDIDLVQYLENLTNQNGENDSQVQLLNGLIVFSVCLHELVHFEDFNFDGLMQGDNDEDLGELFEAIYQGGYFEFDENNDVVFIKAN